MAVSRCAQTLMGLLNVPVDMDFVLAVMGGAVRVSTYLCLEYMLNSINYAVCMYDIVCTKDERECMQ